MTGQQKPVWFSRTNSDGERLRAFEAVLGNMPFAVGLLRLDGTPIFFNRAFMEVHGTDTDTAGTMTFEQLTRDGRFSNWSVDAGEYFARLRESLLKDGEFTAEMEIGDRVVLIHDVLLDGEYILTTQQDVTKRVVAERRVEHLASHDPLTGLPNRAAFNRELERVMEEARATSRQFAVVSVDLDRFKDVNDVFGHGMGDGLLQEIARRFARIAGDAFVARLGGDEFTFICRERLQPGKAAVLADRLLRSAAGEAEINGRSLLVGLSIGIAIFPTDGEDTATLLNNADAALYRAKADGRGVARFYEPEMDARIHEKRILQQELRLAIARHEFVLDYQPQATISGEITGFEVLVRWNHPSLGLIMPDKFISIAEETGLIIELGDWILREACREAATWSKPLQVAVNLSPVQFRHGDLAQRVHEILLQTGLPPSRLEVEITEGTLIEDFARALTVLRRLKALGVHVAMDDFGVGYSSLSYLQSFPFDKLKIDRSFTAGLGENEHALEIIRAVIGLGRGLKIPIVAEGVETSEQLSVLSNEHCYGVQGFLIGKPKPIDTYAETLGRPPGQKPADTRHGDRRRRADRRRKA